MQSWDYWQESDETLWRNKHTDLSDFNDYWSIIQQTMLDMQNMLWKLASYLCLMFNDVWKIGFIPHLCYSYNFSFFSHFVALN